MHFKRFIFFLLIGCLFFLPHDTYAQSITPTNFLIKNSNNTAVLYQSSSRDYFTSTPYYSGKFEINLGATNVEYNASYGLDLYLTLYVGAFSDYGDFGYGNPELYINNNGLHQTGYTISAFTNRKGSCSNVVCPYQLHLSFTFATQYQGTIYLALPYDIPYDTYGWTLNSMELTNYGSNTSNSDIIANNNQNTQNIISNNNNNTNNIINNQNSISQQIINNSTQNTQEIKDTLTDDTPVPTNELQAFIDDFPVISNGPISGILQIPLRFLDYLTTIFSSRNCGSPISLGTLYNNEIKLQCIDVESKVGSDLYSFIDYIGAILVFYLVLMNIISCWETWTNFEDNFNSLYVGKHTKQGYTPRHGGDL